MVVRRTSRAATPRTGSPSTTCCGSPTGWRACGATPSTGPSGWDAYKQWVTDTEKAFEDAGVGGTPTVLVDGTALPGGNALHDAAEFSKALRDAGV
ncbi:hypothetical protein AB0B30_29685 [Streptomyces narbonensis]|uniref:Thioredoxin-like fold domain-containing protein n=1 Tax=Streptomyces narbonensis TaxID=67333 RepID=A0ABV3CE69_9ACTN